MIWTVAEVFRGRTLHKTRKERVQRTEREREIDASKGERLANEPRIRLDDRSCRSIKDVDEFGNVGRQVFGVVEKFYGRSSEDWDVEVEEDDLSGEGCDLRDEGGLRAEDGADTVGTMENSG